jgi:hypothetical protein
MTEMIDTKQVGLHFEKANMAAEMVERGKDHVLLGAVTAGVELNAAKAIVPHGEWSTWLGKHWDYSHSLANKYMRIANSERVTNLTEAKSVRQALAMAAVAESGVEEDEVETPRAKRKSGQVVVSKSVSNEARSNPGQTVVQPDHTADADNMVDENAVKAEPKTNTKHSPATAKAKEADRAVPMAVTPVIVEEPEPKNWPDVSLEDLVTRVIDKLGEEKQRKAAAKTLRKLADRLDPPTKFVKPTVDEVAEYCRERRNNIDAESFVAFYSTNGWKLSNGNKMADWKSAVVTWEKRNDSGNKQSGGTIAGTGRIKPGKIDESQIEWR